MHYRIHPCVITNVFVNRMDNINSVSFAIWPGECSEFLELILVFLTDLTCCLLFRRNCFSCSGFIS